MTMKIGIRDLVRNSNILDGYDYLEVEDKKTHEYKGIFVSPKYAEEFKAFLEEKIAKEHQAKLERIIKYAGKGQIDTQFEILSSAQIKEKKAMEFYAEK